MGLDTPAVSPNEFQRADMAPASTLGDGIINSGDTVQARRYATGLDAVQNAGGPTEPVVAPQGVSKWIDDLYSYFSGRSLSIGDGGNVANGTVTLPVSLDAYGEVCGVSFTLEFDPAIIKNVRIERGTDAPEGSVLTINSSDAANGRIAILHDSIIPITADGAKNILSITFDVESNAAGGETQLRISSGMAAIGISDALGNDLSVYASDRTLKFGS